MFITKYTKKCLDEENQRKLVKEEEKRIRDELFKKKSEINMNRQRVRDIEFEVKPEEKKIRYCDGSISYKNKIKYALNEDENAIEFISRHLREWGNSDDFKIITSMFRYCYLKGNTKSKEIYERILNKAGLGSENIDSIDKDKNEVECPFCKGRLNLKYGKYGMFVSCSSYPECKFSFNI